MVVRRSFVYESSISVAKIGTALEPISIVTLSDAMRTNPIDEHQRQCPTLHTRTMRTTMLNKNSGNANCRAVLWQVVIPETKQDGIPKSRLSHEMIWGSELFGRSVVSYSLTMFAKKRRPLIIPTETVTFSPINTATMQMPARTQPKTMTGALHT